MYVCMYACMHVCMYVCMYVYMYVGMYSFMCVGICVCDITMKLCNGSLNALHCMACHSHLVVHAAPCIHTTLLHTPSSKPYTTPTHTYVLIVMMVLMSSIYMYVYSCTHFDEDVRLCVYIYMFEIAMHLCTYNYV